ncbi:cytochrome c-type biogenesis protein [Oceanicella actignis]|uniref:cytochrome c-type biogenesis protein n=1 Tax=Oceanicella actignis TaxID=1189325 RepID=UPI0011E60CDE|nr:cytochrome c-type biogenesis protein [Oceanicella actignis]TYO90178.1 cytochrome c-type biogenesis protein CcmH [Oceanicella actignis]
MSARPAARLRAAALAALCALAALGAAPGPLGPGPALAVQPDEMLDDPQLEARARALSKELRCLVCRNENIDDSNADLARDLRILVRERIKAGDSDEEVLRYLVDRYGEFVLLRPRFSLGNAALWLGGPAMLLLGGIAAWRFVRRAGRGGAEAGAAAPLTEEERARIARLLED